MATRCGYEIQFGLGMARGDFGHWNPESGSVHGDVPRISRDSNISAHRFRWGVGNLFARSPSVIVAPTTLFGEDSDRGARTSSVASGLPKPTQFAKRL